MEFQRQLQNENVMMRAKKPAQLDGICTDNNAAGLGDVVPTQNLHRPYELLIRLCPNKTLFKPAPQQGLFIAQRIVVHIARIGMLQVSKVDQCVFRRSADFALCIQPRVTQLDFGRIRNLLMADNPVTTL